MRKKLLSILALGLLITSIAYGEESVDKQSKIIKNLTTRLETLENTVYDLKQEVANLKNASNTSSASAQVPVAEKPISTPAAVINTEVAAPEPDKKSLVSAEKEKYDIALGMLKEGKLTEREQKFSEFIAEFPNSSLQSNAYFWYGESFYQRNNHNEAAINYLKGYKLYPKGAKAADSLLKLAFSLSSLNRNKEACSMLEKLDNEFPNRPSASLKRASEAKTKFGCIAKKKN